MLTVFAIVGCPNVGKSMLFNVLTRSSNALVADLPGVTRDRQYGQGRYKNQPFILVDTGGMTHEQHDLSTLINTQTQYALKEADVLLWMVDAKIGFMPQDRLMLEHLRQYNKPIIMIVNKIDGLRTQDYLGEFTQTGIRSMCYVSAAHRRGIDQLLVSLSPYLRSSSPQQAVNHHNTPKRLVILGRPNVGKSTLVNQLLGSSRMVVSPLQGTTRDAIGTLVKYAGAAYWLVDTPGVRRQAKVHSVVEKYSIIKSLQALHDSDIVIALLDGEDLCTQQDLRLLRFIVEAGKACVIGINKSDQFNSATYKLAKQQLIQNLPFLRYINKHFISAKTGKGIRSMMRSVQAACKNINKPLPTHTINTVIGEALKQHPPPRVKGQMIKIRYAHLGGRHPLSIVIHGRYIKQLSADYQRYLLKAIREHFQLTGIPLRLLLRETPKN